MKKELKDLIHSTEKLQRNLELFAKEYRLECEELENEFEKMSWDVHCMIDDLKMIQRYKDLNSDYYESQRNVG
jgi:hypothetical protein